MSGEVQAPTTYSEWISCFEILRNAGRDDELMEMISKGKVPFTQTIAQRFTGKMSEAISYRLEIAVDKFSKDLGRARGEENAIVQAILALRRQVSYLMRFVTAPVFPEQLRNKFKEEIEKNAQLLHDNLLEEVRKDPSGRLIRVVQHTPILPKEPQTNTAPIPMGKTKRRIIFDE
jgi:hypothetical protein